jgi:hypothetical protein
MRWPAALLIVLLILPAACRTTGQNRPSWIKQGTNLEHPDLVLIVGSCRGKVDENEARQCALRDAREQLRSVYNVAGGLVRDEHTESRFGTVARGNANVLVKLHDAWVLMGYPRNRLLPP